MYLGLFVSANENKLGPKPPSLSALGNDYSVNPGVFGGNSVRLCGTVSMLPYCLANISFSREPSSLGPAVSNPSGVLPLRLRAEIVPYT